MMWYLKLRENSRHEYSTQIYKLFYTKTPYMNTTTRLRLLAVTGWTIKIFRTWRQEEISPETLVFYYVIQQTFSCCNYVAHSFHLWWNTRKLNSLRRWTINPGNITHFQQIEMVWSPPAIPCLFLSIDASLDLSMRFSLMAAEGGAGALGWPCLAH